MRRAGRWSCGRPIGPYTIAPRSIMLRASTRLVMQPPDLQGA